MGKSSPSRLLRQELRMSLYNQRKQESLECDLLSNELNDAYLDISDASSELENILCDLDECLAWSTS